MQLDDLTVGRYIILTEWICPPISEKDFENFLSKGYHPNEVPVRNPLYGVTGLPLKIRAINLPFLIVEVPKHIDHPAIIDITKYKFVPADPKYVKTFHKVLSERVQLCQGNPYQVNPPISVEREDNEGGRPVPNH